VGICATPGADSLYPKEVGSRNHLWITRKSLGCVLPCVVDHPVCLGFPCKVTKFGSNCPLLAVMRLLDRCAALSNKWKKSGDHKSMLGIIV